MFNHVRYLIFKIKIMKIFCLFFISLIYSTLIFSQNKIQITNASFEGEAFQGVNYNDKNKLLKEWTDCTNYWNFDGETPYDVHTTESKFWGVKQQASHGNSFISLVVRQTDTFEGISQKLTSPLKANKCYELEIDISKSERMMSQVASAGNKQLYFDTDAVLKISFGNELCQISKCVAKSKPVSNTEWKRYKFQFKPQENYNYITFSAFWDTPVLEAYNGNILIDNLSNIKEVGCSDFD